MNRTYYDELLPVNVSLFLLLHLLFEKVSKTSSEDS